MMKKTNILFDMHSKIITELHNIDEIMTTSIKELKKELKKEKESEVKKEVLKEKEKLLIIIAKDLNTDLTLFRKKYLNNEELNIIEKNNSISSINNDQILDKIEFEGNIYYYENKENGKVYNTKSKLVGYLKDNVICFDI